MDGGYGGEWGGRGGATVANMQGGGGRGCKKEGGQVEREGGVVLRVF